MNEELMSTAEDMEVVEEGNMDWVEQATPDKPVESWSEPLLKSVVNDLQSRWNSIQTEFVDEPRASVEHADALVVEAVEKIVKRLSEKRAILDEQWAKHEDVSTEDLRIALQGYRSFFNRLLKL